MSLNGDIRFLAPSGPQPAEHETVQVEGNLETSYLLEQVSAISLCNAYILSFAFSLRPSVAPCVSSARRIRSLRAKISCARWKLCLRCQNLLCGSPRHHWYPPDRLIARTPIPTVIVRPHQYQCAPLLQNRNCCTGKSSSMRPPQRSLTCRLLALIVPTAARARYGWRRRKRLRIRCGRGARKESA